MTTAMPWVLTALAVAASVYRVVLVMSKSVDPDALGAVLLRLFRAGDLSRARKLLSVIPGASVGVAMAAVVTCADGFPRGSDERRVRAGLERAFTETFAIEKKSVGASQFLSGLSLLCAAGALATSLQLGSPPVPLLVALAVVLLLVGKAALVVRGIDTGGPRVLERTLPALVEHLCAPSATSLAGAAPGDASKTVPLSVSPSAEPRPKPGVIFVDVLHAGKETRHLELSEPVIKIGTLSTAHVPIEAEKGVGRMHAVIERTDEGAQIIDLGNQAGTLVGGAKVTRTKLQQGDEVVVGTTTLRIGLGLPPTHLELEPLDTDEPKTWDPAATFLYGFDTRSPDLFYEIVEEIVRGSPAAKGLRLAKLRRPSGAPAFVVALLGDEAAVKVARAAIEQQADARYARCATPRAEIAPDATYGRETSTSARVRDELSRGDIEVLVTVVV